MDTIEKLKRELKLLREENVRLKSLLTENGIPYRIIPQRTVPTLSLEEKVALFRSLFKGREDVFARRWCGTTSGKSGYQPECLRE